MMKMKRKIRCSKGETLVETLVAMTIVSLVSSLLFVMITGTHQLNTQAIKNDIKFYDELTRAEVRIHNKHFLSHSHKTKIVYGPNFSETDDATLVTLYGRADGLISYGGQ